MSGKQMGMPRLNSGTPCQLKGLNQMSGFNQKPVPLIERDQGGKEGAQGDPCVQVGQVLSP